MTTDNETETVRDIGEILDIAEKSGYSSLTDAEIDKLIEYKVTQAEDSAIVRIAAQESQQKIEYFANLYEQRSTEAKKLFDDAMQSLPKFQTVEKEVDGNGEE